MLRAFERFDEAIQALDLASVHQDRLGFMGRELFARRKEWLLQRPSYKPLLPIPAWEIDLKQLYSMNFNRNNWSVISSAAEDRRMFLLAYETYLDGKGWYDSEILKDHENLRCENESDRASLNYMRQD